MSLHPHYSTMSNGSIQGHAIKPSTLVTKTITSGWLSLFECATHRNRAVGWLAHVQVVVQAAGSRQQAAGPTHCLVVLHTDTVRMSSLAFLIAKQCDLVASCFAVPLWSVSRFAQNICSNRAELQSSEHLLRTSAATELQSCRAAELQSCRAAELQSCRAAELQSSSFWLVVSQTRIYVVFSENETIALLNLN